MPHQNTLLSMREAELNPAPALPRGGRSDLYSILRRGSSAGPFFGGWPRSSAASTRERAPSVSSSSEICCCVNCGSSPFPTFPVCCTVRRRPVIEFIEVLTVGRVSCCFQEEAARYCDLLRKTSPRVCLFRCCGLFRSRPSRKLELDLALIIQDEPCTKRFASSGTEA